MAIFQKQKWLIDKTKYSALCKNIQFKMSVTKPPAPLYKVCIFFDCFSNHGLIISSNHNVSYEAQETNSRCSLLLFWNYKLHQVRTKRQNNYRMVLKTQSPIEKRSINCPHTAIGISWSRFVAVSLKLKLLKVYGTMKKTWIQPATIPMPLKGHFPIVEGV